MVKKVTVLLSLVLLVSFAGCTNSVGKIKEINQSPSGSYQIDEVNWSGGATAGESYLVIESPADGVFSGRMLVLPLPVSAVNVSSSITKMHHA